MLNRDYIEDEKKDYTILYVDDEEVNLRVFNRNFSKFYDVYTAIDAEEAQEILAAHHIDLIMTDQMMPGMNGSDLLLKIVPMYPTIIRMIMTGFSDESDISEVVEKIGLHKFLKKPWDQYQLRQVFDDALEEREEKLKEAAALEQAEDLSDGSKDTTDFKLDLLESTMSLTETKESKQLKDDLNDLVSKSKSKDSEFMDSGLNHLVNLKDALLPIQHELKLYAEDAFIVYDKNTVNQNSYWFGEKGDDLVVVSFHTNAEPRDSITLNAFLGAALTEAVYKESCLEPDELLNMISSIVKVRLIEMQGEKPCPLEIGVLIANQEKDTVKYSGAYHNMFFLDKQGGFHEVKGNEEALIPGQQTILDINQYDISGIRSMYLVPFSVLAETNDGVSDCQNLQMLLQEVGKLPFGMQTKMFKEYGYKSAIGLKI